MTPNFPEVVDWNAYQRITTQDELEALLDLVGGFHDGVLKEVHLVSSGYVHSDLTMATNMRYTARILIQRQFENPSAVELLAGAVTTLQLGEPGIVFDASGELRSATDTGGTPEFVLRIDNDVLICLELYGRDASSWMGIQTRFGEEIPFGQRPVFNSVGGTWVQCSHCSEAWDSNGRGIARCPRCHLAGETNIAGS